MSIRSSRLVLCALALFAGLLAPVMLHAQGVSGTILGTITDQQGAAIGKAEISARSVDTGVTRKGNSADNGDYRITAVPAGTYEVSIGAPGFKTEVRSGIIVTVGADSAANFQLTVGAVTEKVEVTAEVAQVDTSSATMGGFVNSTTIRELPLNGRDWLQLALLQPGVQYNAGSSGGNDSLRTQRGNGMQISVSGGRMAENVFRIDGLVVNDFANSGPGSALRVNMGVDAIREFSILSNSYTAEYGRGASGVINAITKSGTNEYHGSAYYFHRNSALDARNFFDGLNVAPFRRHQFGGALGGAIKKDKTFFFTNYEQITEIKSLSQSFDTISNDARRGLVCANSACSSKDQVALDPRIQPFLDLYPRPNGVVTGDTGRFQFPGARPGQEKYVIGKIDHYFTSNTTLFGSYSWDNSSIANPDHFGQKQQLGPSRRQNGLLTLQHLFSPTLISNTRIGVSRTYAANNLDCCATIPLLEQYGGPNSFIPGRPIGRFDVGGLSGRFGGVFSDGLNTFSYTSPQIYSDLSWTKGRHTIKMGYAMERVRSNMEQQNRANGLWTFGSIRDMLQVRPNQFSGDLPGTDGIRGQRQWVFGTYIQDDFRVRSNLTINIGVRYETTTVLKEVNGKIANLRYLTDPAATTGDPYFNNPTFKNFAPRIGFSWDPFKDGKTAIRGGWGFFDIPPLPYQFTSMIPRSAPFYIQGTINNPPASAFPGGGVSLFRPSSSQVTHVQFDPRRAYKMQWNFNIQRQLTRSIGITTGYVGSQGTRISTTVYDHNQVPPHLVRWDGAHLIFPIPLNNSTANIARLNPNVGQIRTQDYNGHSTYHAWQTNLTQRVNHGLSYQVAYTWSKSIDNGTNSTSDNESLNSKGRPWAFCDKCNRGPSDYDLTHSMVANFLYDIPVLASVKANKFANTVLGGWQIGGIYTVQSGGVISVRIPVDRAFTGNTVTAASQGGQTPDWLATAPGCADPTTGNITKYLKTNCWQFPGAGVLGNSPKNRWRMPMFRNLDFSLYKNQNVMGEKLKAQLRLEMFNIFNNTNLVPQAFFIFNGQGVINQTAGTPQPPTVNSSRQIQLGLRLLF